ncbi:MAG TPA: DinB family protein [Acidobacteriaceae bacterium]
MTHELENTIALLAHTPAALDGLLRSLPEMWTHANEGEGTWTVCDVIAHLIEADRVNWMPRARHILEHGDLQPFRPFDREGGQENKAQTLTELLDAFARERSEKLAQLRALHLQPADLERRGYHPALGNVTLSQLLATWATHDLTHLHQVTRIMAGQYSETVGPWKKFLGVLHCEGHSEPA